MKKPRIKICGITRLEDALMCVDSGVDALGLVFYPPSSRNLDIDTALQIINGLPPFIIVVGLFMNAKAQQVNDVITACRFDRLQFHGSETAAYCRQFGIPYFKALAMGGDAPDFHAMATTYSGATAFLLDSHQRDKPGGSGVAFDWSVASAQAAAIKKPLILAGGLTPDNVQSAIKQIKPYAVDCSSGVEMKPGIKDPVKVRRFVQEIDNASTYD